MKRDEPTSIQEVYKGSKKKASQKKGERKTNRPYTVTKRSKKSITFKPDISFIVSIVSQFLNNPMEERLNVVY